MKGRSFNILCSVISIKLNLEFVRIYIKNQIECAEEPINEAGYRHRVSDVSDRSVTSDENAMNKSPIKG